jgi:hypothetical protein
MPSTRLVFFILCVLFFDKDSDLIVKLKQVFSMYQTFFFEIYSKNMFFFLEVNLFNQHGHF